MKKENSLTRFTDDECVLLASLAIVFFNNKKANEKKNKSIPERSPKEIKLEEEIRFVYQLLLDNANSIFNIKEEGYAFALGLIVISIREFGDLKNEEKEDSILEKFDDFLMTIPSWAAFINEVNANRKKE